MPENSLFKGMAETCDLATTVLTCEGNIGDPHFCRKLNDLISKLNQLISNGRAPFNVTRVEPWNSVRITFNIPREAAHRLRQLAEQGDNSLRELGILSVQIEGDQVITLTLSGRYNGATQESLFRADSLNQKLENVRNPSCLPHISSPGNLSSTSKDSCKASTDGLFKSEADFRSPNVVAPSSNEPIPFTTEASRLSNNPHSSTSHPFPFASMTHAMSTKHHGPASSVRFPFSSALARTHLTSTVTTISTNAQSTSVPIVQKTSSTASSSSSSSLLNNLVSHSSSLFNNSSSSSSNKGVSLSSPLLVNLLQSEGAQPNKMMPPPAPVANNPIKKKRRPRKLKEPDSLGHCVLSSQITTQGSSSFSQKVSQVRSKHIAGITANSKKDICKLSSMTALASTVEKSKHLVNPFTGQVESSDEDDEDMSLNSPNDSSSSSSNSLARSNSGNNNSTLWEHPTNQRVNDSSFLPREMAKQDASSGEKLKLRLKLDTKTVKESKEPSTIRDKRMKPDFTPNNKLEPCGPPAKRSKIKDPLQELRVPPLHISLRGPNAAVVVSPKKEDQKIRKTPNNIVNQELEKQLTYMQKKSRSLRSGSSPTNKPAEPGEENKSHQEDNSNMANGTLEDGHMEESLPKDETAPPPTDSLEKPSVDVAPHSTQEESKQLSSSPSLMESSANQVVEPSGVLPPDQNHSDPNEASQENSLVFRGLIATPGGETPESTSSQDMPECGAKNKDNGSSPSADLEEEDKHSLDYPCHQLETPPDSGGPDFSLDDHAVESSDEFHHTSFSNKLETFGSEPQKDVLLLSPLSCSETPLNLCPPKLSLCEKRESLDEEEILKATESLLTKATLSTKLNNIPLSSLTNDKLLIINSLIKENNCLPYSEMKLNNFPSQQENCNSIFLFLSTLLSDLKSHSSKEAGNIQQPIEVPSLAKAAKHSLLKALCTVYIDHSLPEMVLNYITSTVIAKNNLLPPSKLNSLMLKHDNLEALALETKGLFQHDQDGMLSSKLPFLAKNNILTLKINSIPNKGKENIDIKQPQSLSPSVAATLPTMINEPSSSDAFSNSPPHAPERQIDSAAAVHVNADSRVETQKDEATPALTGDSSDLPQDNSSHDKTSKEVKKESSQIIALHSSVNRKETCLNLVPAFGSSHALVTSKRNNTITTLTASNLNSLFAHAKRIALNSTSMFSGNGTLRLVLKSNPASKFLPFKLINLSSGVLELFTGQGSSSDATPLRRLVMSKRKVMVKVPGLSSLRHPSTSHPLPSSDIVIVSSGTERPLLDDSLELESNKKLTLYSSPLARLPPTTSDCDSTQIPAGHVISPPFQEENKDSTLKSNSDAFRPNHQDNANSLVSKKPLKRKCSENAARLIKACVTLDNEANARQNRQEEVAYLNNNDLISSAKCQKANNEDSSDFQDEDSDDDMTLSELVEASKAKLAVVQTFMKEEPHLVYNRGRKRRIDPKKSDDTNPGVKLKRENKKTYFTANDIKRTCGISDKAMKNLHQEGFTPLCDIVDSSPSRNKKAKESESWPLKEEMAEISTLAKRKLRGTGLLDCPEPLTAKRRRSSAKEIHR